MTTTTRYIDAADAAKMIRKALREAFGKAVKFAVRTSRYAGGCSIDVRWTDGPSRAMVESITSRFAGASFDGMTDSTSYHVALLDGEPVRFSSDYVHTSREFSDRAIARGLRHIARMTDLDITVEDYRRTGFMAFRGDQHVEREFNAFLSRHAFTPGRRSPTAEQPAATDANAVTVHADGLVECPEHWTDEQREAALEALAFVAATADAVRTGRAPLALVIDNTARH